MANTREEAAQEMIAAMDDPVEEEVFPEEVQLKNVVVEDSFIDEDEDE